MRKIIFYMAVVALLSSCNTHNGNVLQIAEQGSFAVGGTVLTDSLGRNDGTAFNDPRSFQSKQTTQNDTANEHK